MTVQWHLFALVVLVALGSAVVVTTLFAGGIRLLATPRDPVPGAPARDEEEDVVPRGARPAGVTFAGVTLFVLAGAAALGGVLLILLG
ncbi:hypothetical protein [Amnibacterium endophyticum]|uniref:Integral membrane protein n=1 Tax=Amnibacterium endophyticum TaxID=2109337 RepID=A0ABW4LIN6_9MICO